MIKKGSVVEYNGIEMTVQRLVWNDKLLECCWMEGNIRKLELVDVNKVKLVK